MTKINFGRLFIGGLVATAILFLTDGLIHEHLVHEYWENVYDALGARDPGAGHGIRVVYFLVFEVGRGFTAILIYILMRPFYAAGPKTAVFSALAAWFAFSVTGPAQFIPLGFYGRRMWVIIAAVQLVTSVGANLVAAWIYRDPATSVSPVED